jgi:hypothetical protein
VQLATAPVFSNVSIAGADAACIAQFGEASSFGAAAKPRLRLVIVSRGSAAVIDAQAASPQAWQVAFPSFQALIGTLRVDTAASVTSEATPATRGIC